MREQFTKLTRKHKSKNISDQYAKSKPTIGLILQLKKRRNVWNSGIGIGQFDNYDQLDERTPKNAFAIGSKYIEETKSVAGKRISEQYPNFARKVGMLLSSSAFIPLNYRRSANYIIEPT